MNVFFLILLTLCVDSACAQTAMPAPIHGLNSQFLPVSISIQQYQQLPIEQQKTMAEIWNLEIKDYRRYLWLMQNSPSGLYYADKYLDPSWVLGFDADNDEARKKYALIAIQNERKRIEKELAFQRAFNEMQKTLYPHDLPIAYAALSENTNSGAPIKHKQNEISG